MFHLRDRRRPCKRLIGLPGDRIKIVDGDLFINGEKVPEPYVKDKDMGTYFDGKEVVVPDESYFFLGDNRPVSMDARTGLILSYRQNI